jgi:RNA ligase (TIGR02306 family)
MKLATIEHIQSIVSHPNADKLDLATVSGYTCVVGRNQYSVGEAVVLIQPDTVLPHEPWSELFRKRSNRVRATKLRGEWSFGVVMPFSAFFDGMQPVHTLAPGCEVSHLIGVTKYEPAQPQHLDAMGYPPTGLPKTDEERYQNLDGLLPYGERVDITLKIDGQSATYYCKMNADTGEYETGICSRSLRLKPECQNNYTRAEARYNILAKLKEYCVHHSIGLAIRGEVYGAGIQAFVGNPHATGAVNFALFSVWNFDTHAYECIADSHYYANLGYALNIPCVPCIEKDVILTPDIVKYYAQDIDHIDDKPFEGVVVKHNSGSFKVLNLSYDSLK